MRKPLIWKFYPIYIGIITSTLILITWYSTHVFKNFYLDQKENDLGVYCRFIEDRFQNFLVNATNLEIDYFCHVYGRKTMLRITVVDSLGHVLGDSEEDYQIMDNHGNRPEIITAIKRGSGSSIRWSRTVNKNMMYFASRFNVDKSLFYVVRVSVPIAALDQALKSIYLKITMIGIFIAFVALIIVFIISKKFTRTIFMIKQAAQRFSNGELSQFIDMPENNSEELYDLVYSLNQMAKQLDERIQLINQQKIERDALLASMTDAIMAIDTHENIIYMNEKARELFVIKEEQIKNKTLRQMIRNTKLYEFVQRVFKERKLIEEHISVYGDQPKHFQVRGTMIQNKALEVIGGLIVFNDITKLNFLEKVRKDFVANVSHELKTPITAINGFIETLQDGAINDLDQAKRFIDIIAKQTHRLSQIVEDLLSLSRLEQNDDHGSIEFSNSNIEEIIKAACEVCLLQAKEKNISFNIDIQNSVSSWVSSNLLEQALINLIDNAIKYSDPSSTIDIILFSQEKTFEIWIRDYGFGIEVEHLKRIFERFYRVDKARSRKLGGTGLGLSIVKHIIKLHQGDIIVESWPKKGSLFKIWLPINHK